MNRISAAPARGDTLIRLFWPIFLETLGVMLGGVIDTLMLTYVGDLAVGAVGTANAYINVLIVLFNIASFGMLAVMTQYIGAGKKGIATQALKSGLAFNASLGVALSLGMVLFSSSIFGALGVAPTIAQPAETYMRIVGGGCLANALISVFSVHLRAFGHTKQPFIAAMVGYAVNIALNAYFLYVRHAGVAGVAAATVISRVAQLTLVALASRKLRLATEAGPTIPNRTIMRQIVRVGVPSACENIIYSLSVTIIVSLINQQDPTGFHIAARAYALQFSSFSHSATSAFGQANAIMAGWYVGSGKFDECTLGTRRAAVRSGIVAFLTGCVIAFFSPLYMRVFTSDGGMIRTILTLLTVNIVLEVGRAVNVCYGNALKAIGDARFPMGIGLVFMLLCGSGGTWFFGGIVGIAPSVACFLGMLLDECIRAVLMILRWRSGVWKTKTIMASV